MSKPETLYQQKTKLREAVISAYHSGEITRDIALSKIKVSKRQFIRLSKEYRLTNSLKHKLIGKSSNHSLDPELKSHALILCSNLYSDCNYAHISDLMQERNNISLNSYTIRNWMIADKLTKPKLKSKPKHTWREPKPMFNQMLQLDGTFGYFLGDGRLLCLMHLVDDSTKESLAMLFEAESTNSALQLLYQWCLKYGIPDSIYSDRHSTYKVNRKTTIKEDLKGLKYSVTQFGEVCNRLGIKQIFANSPQAKGRVERKHQLYKDRWIKELRLDGIKTIEDANKYLLGYGGFVDKLNQKFTIEPKEYRAQTPVSHSALYEYFTLNNSRKLRNDYTISFNTRVYQLTKNSIVNNKSTITIKQYLDESIAIFIGTHKLEYSIIENYTKPQNTIKPELEKPYKPKYVQSKDHPYRRYQEHKKHAQTASSSYLQKIASYYG